MLSLLCFAFLPFFLSFLQQTTIFEQGSGVRENRIGRIGRRFWKILGPFTNSSSQ
jgi:hypothetical protein